MNDLTKGFDELSKELAELSKSADPARRKDALEDGAEIIVARARSLAPVRTGLLKREGIVKGNITGDFVDVGWTDDGFYGRFLEYGTSKMAPRSHLRPAYEQTKTQVVDVMLRKLKLL